LTFGIFLSTFLVYRKSFENANNIYPHRKYEQKEENVKNQTKLTSKSSTLL